MSEGNLTEQRLSEDDIIDALPLHLQNRVLRSIQVQEDGSVVRRRAPERQTTGVIGQADGCLLIVACLWAMVWCVIGMLVCLTIVFIPIGIGLLFFGCAPLTAVIVKTVKKGYDQGGRINPK
jgi:hypothetical protein